MKWNQAIRLLEECEQNLRKLLADAAGEGDYASVQRLAFLAKAVGALAAENDAVTIPNGRPAVASTLRGEALRDETQAKASPRSVEATKTGRRSRHVDGYPKFFRRANELVKVGWSKKDRREYNHRAPREIVAEVAKALRHVGARGKMFNGDALLPLKHPITQTPTPAIRFTWHSPGSSASARSNRSATAAATFWMNPNRPKQPSPPPGRNCRSGRGKI